MFKCNDNCLFTIHTYHPMYSVQYMLRNGSILHCHLVVYKIFFYFCYIILCLHCIMNNLISKLLCFCCKSKWTPDHYCFQTYIESRNYYWPRSFNENSKTFPLHVFSVCKIQYII